jgi:hypothetical protein
VLADSNIGSTSDLSGEHLTLSLFGADLVERRRSPLFGR